MKTKQHPPLTRIVTVFKSERIEVIRTSYRENGDWDRTFDLFFDGDFVQSFGTQNDAEHAGAMLLEDEMRKEAA